LWLLSKLTRTPAGNYRELRQTGVMTAPDFSALIRSQPWSVAALQFDGWYQYAVCEKASTPLAGAEQQEQPADWTTV
jgi:hypothetical protein